MQQEFRVVFVNSPVPSYNTLAICVEALNQQWELPDNLAIKWNEYEKEHPLAADNSNADQLHQDWFNALTPDEQSQVIRFTRRSN